MTEENLNRPAWGVDETHPFLKHDLEDAFASVSDPELGYSVLELGLIRNVTIENNVVTVEMILTTPYCPYGPSMMEEVREKVSTIGAADRNEIRDSGVGPDLDG